MQFTYQLAAAALLAGGVIIFAVFLGTTSGVIAGTALIAVGVAAVIFAVF